MHEKYIKRGEKIHGPYYYKSYRDSEGNVKKVYLGKNVSVKNTVTLQESKRFTKGFYIAIFVLIAFILLSIALERPSITGNAVDDVVSFGILEPTVEETVIEENKTEEIVEEEIIDIKPVEEMPLEEIKEEVIKENNKEENVSFDNQEIIFGAAALNLDDCGNISEPGEYILTADLTNESTCFNIESDDVSLDCDGYSITYNTAETEKGNAINMSNETALNNITIANCFVQFGPVGATGFDQPIISFVETSNLTIFNNTFETVYQNSIVYGIAGEDLNITQNVISTNGSGIYLTTINNSYISENNLSNIEDTGATESSIRIDYSENLTIDSNLINSVDSGIGISGSNETNITYNIISINSSTGIILGWTDFNNVSYNNLTLEPEGSDSGTAIKLYDTNYSYVENNNINLSCIRNSTSSGWCYGINLNDNSDSFIHLTRNTIESVSPQGASIYISYTMNVTLSENQINDSHTNAIDIFGKDIEHFNHTIDNTNLVEGFPAAYNFSVSDQTLFTEGDDLSQTYGQFICAACSNVTYNSLNISNDGITVYLSSNVSIKNINISHSKGYGIIVNDATNESIITENNIEMDGGGYYGILITTGETWPSVDSAIINDNIVNLTFDYFFLAGIYVSGVDNALVTNNTVFASALAGIFDTNSTFENNNITTDGLYGLMLVGNEANYFINNNVSISQNNSISDFYYSGYNNSYIWNNSYGEININATEMNVNISLLPGETIFLEQNKVGLIDDEEIEDLNSSADIEIRQLTHPHTPYLYKNANRCDNDDTLCNITYDVGSGILYANVSSFSNYTTDLEPTAAISFSNSLITQGGIETVTCSATDTGGNVANVAMSGDSQSCASASSLCSITYQTLTAGQICFTCTATDTNNLQDIENSCFTVDIVQGGGGGGGGGGTGGETAEAPAAEIIPEQQEVQTETPQTVTEQTTEQEAQTTEEQQMTVNVDYIPQIPLESITVQVSQDKSEVSANLDSQGSMKITIEKTAEGISKPRLDLNFKIEKTQTAPKNGGMSQLPITFNFGLFTIAILI